MNEKVKKLLTMVAVVVMVAVAIIWLVFDGVEHIEDTNGADNYELAVITEEDILDGSMGYAGLSKSQNNLNGTVKFSSKQFTGIYEVFWTDILFTTGWQLDLLNYEVNSGNFKMFVINEGNIIAQLEPGDDYPVDLGEIKGNVSLVIAGESADFSFQMFKHDYESYAHQN